MPVSYGNTANKPLRCGWPFKLPQSTTTVYCSLAMGHDGPYCELHNQAGQTVAAAPRFSVQVP